MKYQQFIFKNYSFDAPAKTLTLQYGYDDALTLTETYKFDFDYVSYSPQALDQALQSLFFMAGVSYYKAFLAPQITVQNGTLSPSDANFLSQTYQNGLGEFFYVNKLDPRTPVNLPTNGQTQLDQNTGNGLLVGLGGGKDSLVSVELLRGQPKVATWSVGHKKQLQPLVDQIGLPHFWVDRQWDRQMLEINNSGAYNGHVPISAILAAAGAVVAILAGYQDVIVSNENSANEPTLNYQGLDINHQYSKSLAFEQAFQGYLQEHFGDSLRYYSFLRPLSELHIAEQFAQYFDKYHAVFSSCNKAFTHDSPGLFWDGICSKCAFVFLALTPFVERSKLESLFSGKNLLLDPELESTYKQLLGIEGDKPLECVGEIKESRAAMQLAQKIYPELVKYNFNLPEDYDYKALAAHNMPEDLYKIIEQTFLA